MKPTTLALVLSAAVGTSCLVSTRSDELTCTTQADCEAPRLCESGYCVIDPDACPAVCNDGCGSDGSCNITGQGGDSITCPDDKTCNITCTGDACDNITCSDAAKCTINCVGTSACNNITCGKADCEITCNGTTACNDITCGSQNSGQKRGSCHLTCVGTTACGDVTCSSACDCVVNGCAGAGDCGTLTCPRSGGTYCTGTGANGPPCTDTNSGCSC